jgi:hypothetical protein
MRGSPLGGLHHTRNDFPIVGALSRFPRQINPVAKRGVSVTIDKAPLPAVILSFRDLSLQGGFR